MHTRLEPVELKAGDDYVHRLEFREAAVPRGSGAPYDVSGSTWQLKLARNEGGAAVDVSFTVDDSHADEGVVTFRVPGADLTAVPREAWLELRWVDDDGRGTTVVRRPVRRHPETSGGGSGGVGGGSSEPPSRGDFTIVEVGDNVTVVEFSALLGSGLDSGGTGVTDGDKGDVTVTGAGTAWSVPGLADKANTADLGDAAGRDVGTLAGDVAAGDAPAAALSAAQAYADQLLADLVNGAPGLLNTLLELADALGNDPNFATTVTTLIGQKLGKSANLSDLVDVAVARSNLGLGALAIKNTITDSDIAGGANIALSKLATNPLARGNHTGQQHASTIDDFDTQVRTSRLDQMAAPTADVGLNGHKATGMADGSAASDGATFGQTTKVRLGLPQGAAMLTQKLQANVEDATWVLVGDSIVYLNWSTAWLGQVAASLAALFPAYTVKVYPYSDDTEQLTTPDTAWETSTTIATGSGSHTLNIYLLAWNGARCDDFLGEHLPQLRALNADLLTVCFGHNEAPINASQPIEMFGGRYASAVETYVQAAPNAGVQLIMQNDSALDAPDQTKRMVEVQRYAARRGFDVVNVLQAFLDNGGNGALTIEGVHPNTAGNTLFASTMFDAFRRSLTCRGVAGLSLLDDPSGQQLAPNGSLYQWRTSPGAPDLWTATGATVTKELTIVEGSKGYSARIDASGAAASSISQVVLNAAQVAALKGRYVTFAVRMYIPTTQQSGAPLTTTGRVRLTDGVNTYTSLAWQKVVSAEHQPRNGWVWAPVTMKIDSAATGLTATVFADTAANANARIYVDRMTLVPGQHVRDTSTTGVVSAARAAVDDLVTTGRTVAGSRVRLGQTSHAIMALFGIGDVWEIWNAGASYASLIGSLGYIYYGDGTADPAHTFGLFNGKLATGTAGSGTQLFVHLTLNDQAGDYSAVLANSFADDWGKRIRGTSAATARTITIPTISGSFAAYANWLEVQRTGAAKLTVTFTSGSVCALPDGRTVSTFKVKKGGVVRLTRTAQNTWQATGDIVLGPRVASVASSATPTIDLDETDVAIIAALAVNVTSFLTNLTGTFYDGQEWTLSITDTGTSRTLAWDLTAFESGDLWSLPGRTVPGVRHDLRFRYNAATSKHRLIEGGNPIARYRELTANTTLALTDVGTTVGMNNGAGRDFTIDSAAGTWPVGAQIRLVRIAGATTIIAAGATTFISRSGTSSPRTIGSANGAYVDAQHLGSNVWLLTGDVV